MQNRYWLFAGANYYPHGGMDDFIKSFQSIEEIKELLKDGIVDFEGDKREIDWYQILDIQECIKKDSWIPVYGIIGNENSNK